MTTNATILSRRETLSRLSAAAAMIISPSAAPPLQELATSKIETEQLCTIEQAAAIEFEPVAEFIGFPAALPQIREKLNRLFTGGSIGMGLLGKTKVQMVEIVRNLEHKDELATSLHECLTEAREYAEELAEFLTAAETRFFVAMAVIAVEQEASTSASAPADQGPAEA